MASEIISRPYPSPWCSGDEPVNEFGAAVLGVLDADVADQRRLVVVGRPRSGVVAVETDEELVAVSVDDGVHLPTTPQRCPQRDADFGIGRRPLAERCVIAFDRPEGDSLALTDAGSRHG